MVERRARVDVRVLAKFTSRLQVDDTSPLSRRRSFLRSTRSLSAGTSMQRRSLSGSQSTSRTSCKTLFSSMCVLISELWQRSINSPQCACARFRQMQLHAALYVVGVFLEPFPDESVTRRCEAGCGRQLEPPKSGGRSRNFICSPRLVRRGIVSSR